MSGLIFGAKPCWSQGLTNENHSRFARSVSAHMTKFDTGDTYQGKSFHTLSFDAGNVYNSQETSSSLQEIRQSWHLLTEVANAIKGCKKYSCEIGLSLEAVPLAWWVVLAKRKIKVTTSCGIVRSLSPSSLTKSGCGFLVTLWWNHVWTIGISCYRCSTVRCLNFCSISDWMSLMFCFKVLVENLSKKESKCASSFFKLWFVRKIHCTITVDPEGSFLQCGQTSTA